MEVVVDVLVGEDTLVVRVLDDPAAFADIYDYYFPHVYNYVRYRISDADAADDITAQTFERALSKIATYRSGKGPFAAWLFTIAKNALREYIRSKKRRNWLSLDVVGDHPSADPLPEEIAARNETYTQLREALATLSDREQEIIALKFGAELTNRTISRLTGMSESNVGVVLFRAVKRLRSNLCGKENEL